MSTQAKRRKLVIIVCDDGSADILDAKGVTITSNASPQTDKPASKEGLAFEAQGDVNYNPDEAAATDAQVVAAEPAIIPIMRSGHESADL